MLQKEKLIVGHRNIVNDLLLNDIWREYIPNEIYEFCIDTVVANYELVNNDWAHTKLFRKVLHTDNTTFIGLALINNEKTVDFDKQTVAVMCFLHDIGRFPQILTGSFFENELGIKHAELGADMIKRKDFKIPNIDIIIDAIRHHSDRVNTNDDKYCKLLRDADKISIIANVIKNDYTFRKPVELIYYDNYIRPEVLDNFLDSTEIFDNLERKSTAEQLLIYCSWYKDLNFEAAKKMWKNADFFEFFIKTFKYMDVEQEKIGLIEKKIISF